MNQDAGDDEITAGPGADNITAGPDADDDVTAGPDADDDVTAGPDNDGQPHGFNGWMRHLFIEGPSFRELIRDTYFTFDRRTLGFSRILFGFLLLTDLFRRTPDWMAMFATTGVLPAPMNLAHPGVQGAFTIVNAFVTPPELMVLWAVMFVTFTCVLVGYKTKLAQVLTIVWVTGLDGRVLLIENGGYVVYNLLALWTAFLPLGDRFSVDAWRESMRRKRETTAAALNDRSDLIPEERLKPHVSLVGLVLCVQLAVIYLFNIIHKTGPGWRKDFTAVHYVIYVDRMVTPLIGKVRDSIPFWATWAMTKFVLGAEAALPFCMLSPLAKRWARLTGVFLILVLHIGFGSVFVLGPFAWALCVATTLFFGVEDWEDTIFAMKREHRARTVLFDPTSPGALYAARALARLDRFELLTFKEAPALPTGIAVRGPRSARTGGAAGWAEIVSALPLGPTVAWLLRVPILGGLLDLAIRILETGFPARFFGVKHAASSPPEGPPSAVRLKGRRVLAVLREGMIALCFAAAINQGLVELWATRDRWYRFIAETNQEEWLQSRGWRLPMQPELFRLLTLKLRFLQGWFMFSPNPVMDDGTIVVDALTADGRHIDPFTLEAPDFDLPNAKSYGYNQVWSDYFNRIRMASQAQYRDAFRAYILRLPERTGHPEDAIVSGDVWWIQDMNPVFGDASRKSYAYSKNKLFSFDTQHIVGQARSATDAPPVRDSE